MMPASPGSQLGADSIERPLETMCTMRPSVSMTTICETLPRSQCDATMRSPDRDQRGSVHHSSKLPSVSGVIVLPSGETRTRCVAPGVIWAATMAPSARTSGCVSRLSNVSRCCFVPRWTKRSERS